jgi:hypothetical protein
LLIAKGSVKAPPAVFISLLELNRICWASISENLQLKNSRFVSKKGNFRPQKKIKFYQN